MVIVLQEAPGAAPADLFPEAPPRCETPGPAVASAAKTDSTMHRRGVPFAELHKEPASGAGAARGPGANAEPSPCAGWGWPETSPRGPRASRGGSREGGTVSRGVIGQGSQRSAQEVEGRSIGSDSIAPGAVSRGWDSQRFGDVAIRYLGPLHDVEGHGRIPELGMRSQSRGEASALAARKHSSPRWTPFCTEPTRHRKYWSEGVEAHTEGSNAMAFSDAVGGPGAFLQRAQGLRRAQGKNNHGTADYNEIERIAQERVGVFANLCWSTRVKPKECRLPVSDGVVTQQQVANISSHVLILKGVLSATAGTKRKQHERSWHIHLMNVDVPGDQGERRM